MKKLFILILAISMIFAFGCTSDKNDPSDSTATKAPTNAPTATATSTEATPTEPAESATPDATPTIDPTPNKPKASQIENVTVVSYDHQEANYIADYAVDGDENTRWSAYDTGKYTMTDYDHFIILDLGKAYTVTNIEVTFESLFVDVAIDISETGEDGSWTNVYDLVKDDNEIPASGFFDFEIKRPASARYLKLYSYVPEDEMDTPAAGHPYFSIWEMSIFGFEGAADATPAA